MTTCNNLFRTEHVFAYYDAAQVNVIADVWLNPFTDHVHICHNPIAMPLGALEFLVQGVTREKGMHPEIITKRRVSYSFAVASVPPNVVVYSMGVDSPSRQQVQVLKTPPPAFQPSNSGPTPPTAPSAVAALAAVAPAPPKAFVVAAHGDVVGYSASFSFDEALQDAITKALAQTPTPNPDVGITVEVKKIVARAKGNIQTGLYVTASAK